ncbi:MULTISPECIES: thiamine pyrophosphate-binding protein [Methylobacterium]|uniref:Thiamine pyrophosphate-binding protein n=1 Tax=Methylobacterium longum TaxID=767694 RepID=A0ABT8AQV5_9HYPH|nr:MULTISPECIES: thiamine pyrophosphate-binding protein [Methylobacterium]MCJ2101122.1 thiamine pyrophosphate-dependent enzyme [Methylobacterium sp. E-046]MDN3571739.1 thiamine pyrophosphate-binding protein [Methylobacterium longum]GJE11597.1 Benzoylformate decarboxylase [Methylobacterium longum]
MPIETVETAGRRRGADLLVEVLRSEGVRYIFGNPGTTELPLIDALTEAPDIAYILALQEATAVAMADGYAQGARRPAFLNLHTAGGLGHAMGGLVNSQVSGTPLVVTAGQQDLRHALTDPLLMGDLVAIADPVMKWAREVTSPDQIPILLRRAFHDAGAAPSGPVFLSLPMDVMEAMSSVPAGETSTIDQRAVAGSLDRLAERLAAIAPGRLALIAGDEIDASDASAQMVALADLLAAPVYGSSWPAHIPFPTAHPLWAGNLPTRADAIADILGRYDAVFALGGKSLITVLYSEVSAVPPGVQVFQLSADVRDLGRTYATALSTVGDIRASLDALLPLLGPRLADRADAFEHLRSQAVTARAGRRARLAAAADAAFEDPVIAPLVAAREVARAVGAETTIVDEAPATLTHLRTFLDSPSAHQYAAMRGGVLGWGMPAAVGFSLGLDRAPVVCVVGDGAAMYSPQALWTAAHERLPVTFVVINNAEYNILKTFMKGQAHYASVRANRFIAMDLTDPRIDFLALAASMGVPGRRVTAAADIAPAIEAGIRSGCANLVEVVVRAT